MSKPIKETIKDRIDRDPEFRKALLTEALEAINCGDVEVAKGLLQDYITAIGQPYQYQLETDRIARNADTKETDNDE